MNEYLNKKKSSGDYGRQETLPPSLQNKMNQSFGMDFSSVKLYRNDEMSGTGMQGLATGNRVIISKDVDLNSKLGQAVLGHELSHIRAQSQGIGMGNSGLYNNAALERQADREGMMAANGQPIFGDRAGMNMGAGMQNMGTLTPLSGGLSTSAGAPMQAKKRSASNDIDILHDSRSKPDTVLDAMLRISENTAFASVMRMNTSGFKKLNAGENAILHFFGKNKVGKIDPHIADEKRQHDVLVAYYKRLKDDETKTYSLFQSMRKKISKNNKGAGDETAQKIAAAHAIRNDSAMAGKIQGSNYFYDIISLASISNSGLAKNIQIMDEKHNKWRNSTFGDHNSRLILIYDRDSKYETARKNAYRKVTQKDPSTLAMPAKKRKDAVDYFNLTREDLDLKRDAPAMNRLPPPEEDPNEISTTPLPQPLLNINNILNIDSLRDADRSTMISPNGNIDSRPVDIVRWMETYGETNNKSQETTGNEIRYDEATMRKVRKNMNPNTESGLVSVDDFREQDILNQELLGPKFDEYVKKRNEGLSPEHAFDAVK